MYLNIGQNASIRKVLSITPSQEIYKEVTTIQRRAAEKTCAFQQAPDLCCLVSHYGQGRDPKV